MSQRAEHVYTDANDVERLEQLVHKLPNDARVTLQCKDGSQRTGTVTLRPTTQVFRGPDQVDGLNAVLRFEDDAKPGVEQHIWLDCIAEVRKLDSISGTVEG